MSKFQGNISHVEIDVTIIVANHNGAKFIADAIRSLSNQSLRGIEIIVSDDASTDASVHIVKGLMIDDARIRLIESDVNAGPAAARNRALKVARGRWISVMDSDDLMHPDRLQSLIEVGIERNADIVADDLLLFNTDRCTPPRTLFAGRWAKDEHWISAEDYVRLNNLYGRGPALGYLKPIFLASFIAKHDIRYDERLRIAEDYNFVFRLLMAGGRFRTVPRIGYFYRRHSGSLSHRLNPSVLTSILDVEQGWAERWPSGTMRSLLRSRERSVKRAIAFEKLVRAIKERQFATFVSLAVSEPGTVGLLRLPLKQVAMRLLSLSRPKPVKSERQQICILTGQRIVGRTNESSRYLLDIVEFLVKREFDVHLLIPSAVTFGGEILKLADDMTVFKTIKFRRTFRIGRYIIGLDPRTAIKGLVGVLDRMLCRTGVLSRPLSRPAARAVIRALTREDQLFVAKEAPATADVQIADYCFLTEAFPYTLRPDARRLVIVRDLFSSHSCQDSVVSLSLEEEVRMLARAETIVANQWEEAAVLQRKLPRHEILFLPIPAAAAGKPQVGESEIVLFVGSSAAPNVDGIRWFIEACWPMIHEQRPNATLYIAGSVCNAVHATPPATKWLSTVEELDGLYADSAVVISPLRTESGLMAKVIEGLSKGKAMVVTSAAMQGVTDILSGCVLVDDTAPGFASKVIDLLGDGDRRSELGARGIAAISKHFSPEYGCDAVVSSLERTGGGAGRKASVQ
jgi:glycosyltransferase involved in cell wall biosynthesis